MVRADRPRWISNEVYRPDAAFSIDRRDRSVATISTSALF
jgi:hypothetical protein